MAAKLAQDPLGPLPEGTNLPEHAAWTVVCNVILNLDEVFMKR
jgi:invasion protein IalB